MKKEVQCIVRTCRMLVNKEPGKLTKNDTKTNFVG